MPKLLCNSETVPEGALSHIWICTPASAMDINALVDALGWDKASPAASPAVPAPSPEALSSSGGGASFKDLVAGLHHDPSLSDAVKDQISVLGDAYNTHDKATFFSKLTELVGKERIKPTVLSLRAAGATVPAKRVAPEEAQAEGQAEKRYRQTIDEVAEEYVCPITAELPIDPVTAEDGRCYERWAIEEWLARQPQPQVKSPMTNAPMGKRLFPAVQLRNTLKRLVESGAISGSKADAWKKAMAEEAQLAAVREKAQCGDAAAMRTLSNLYRDGKHGLKNDLTQAFMWLKRAADLKDVRALNSCGVGYLTGAGVERSNSRGMAMIGMAAALGSEHACGLLGQVNEEGRYGFSKDPQEATRWYLEMQKCDCRDSVEKGRERAAAWLREHP